MTDFKECEDPELQAALGLHPKLLTPPKEIN